jgi:periplasmic copper chaperone A
MDTGTVAPTTRFGRPRGCRRRSLVGLCGIGLALVLGLSACNAGQDAEVTAGTPDVAHAHGDIGSEALDVVFLESGGSVLAGESAPIRGDFINQGATADRLISVSTPAAASVRLLDADGVPVPQGIDIPAHGEVDAVNGVVRLQLVDAFFPLAATQLIPVTFEFSGAGAVTLDVPVAAPHASAP